MARSARQIKILELIAKKDIETQEELASSLLEENYQVTQATVSRDIKELGLVKITLPDGRQKYAKDHTDTSISGKITALFRQVVLSIESAMNIVVIKTLSGSGNSAGVMVDRLENPNILGCVAGDNTVIVVTVSEKAAEGIVDDLNEILYT